MFSLTNTSLILYTKRHTDNIIIHTILNMGYTIAIMIFIT